MAQCVVCKETAVAYVKIYRRRKRIGTYSVCVQHAIFAYGWQELGQDWARSGLASAFGIRKGSVPRIEVSLEP